MTQTGEDASGRWRRQARTRQLRLVTASLPTPPLPSLHPAGPKPRFSGWCAPVPTWE